MLAEKNKTTEENVFWKYGRVKITRENDHYIIQFDTESDPIKNSLGKHIYHGIPSWKIPVKVLTQYPVHMEEIPLWDLAHSLRRLSYASGDILELTDKDIKTHNKDLAWYN